MQVISIRDRLETHKAELESHLTGVLILHCMWRVHHDAHQFFLACKRWEDGEQLPHSTMGNTVRQLVNDCSIQVTIPYPEAMFLGPPLRVPGPTTPSTPGAAQITGPQPTVNPVLPPMCQKVVATFNRLHSGMSVLELCERVTVRFGQLKVGPEGACVYFGLLFGSREVFGLPVQAPGLYRGNQPAGSNSQGHGERIGNDEGRGRGLTGQPGRYTGWPGSITQSYSSLTPTQPVGAAAWFPPGGARCAWVLNLGQCRADRIGLVPPSVSVLSPHSIGIKRPDGDWSILQCGLAHTMPGVHPPPEAPLLMQARPLHRDK